MINLRQPVLALMASAAILLLGMALTFSMQVGTNDAAAMQKQTATTVAMPQEESPAAPEATNNGKTNALPAPGEASVLDADMLNSPVSYLRDAFSPEDEDNTASPFRSGPVLITLKALAASLLSTII